MELTLKNVKVYDGMSQETTCFKATMYVDGKRAGSVENRGYGGNHSWDWQHDQALGEKFEAWAETQELEDEFGKHKQSVENSVDKFLDAWLKADDEKKFKSKIKRRCKTHTLFTFKGQDEYAYYEVKAKFTPEIKARLIAKNGGKIDKFLNETMV